MTIQNFLRKLVISLQNNTEKYRRDQYKARYRALRRKERAQIKRTKFIVGLKIALRFWMKACFAIVFLILIDTTLSSSGYEFTPPNKKALELYSTNKQTFIHAKNLTEIIEFSEENNLLFSVAVSNLILGELIKNSK